jgi:CheY-like chemotaxis protein
VAGPATTSRNHSDNVVGDRQTLLIAEDNADTRQGLADLLRMHDYVVLTSSTGREALTVLENGSIHVDLLISDLMMPDMGGLELLQYLRQNGNPIKTIIVTGHASQETLAELQQLDISGWLIKPIELDELTQVVWKALHA